MTSLLLIGCGNMGSALLSRWKETSPAGISQFHVIDPKQANAFLDLAALPADITPDVIVLAVKPQQLAEILPAYKTRFKNTPLYISIAAGKTLSFFEEHLGTDAKIVRAMPNTPALVGKSITALCANANISDQEKHTAETLLQAVGKTLWVDESQMDAVTALSGSGPAYVFLFLDALSKAGEKLGLSAADAKTLALATLHGSTHLAEKSSETFEQLRKNVTSPGGTTEAALAVLMQNDTVEKLFEEALLAARNRAKTLA